MTQDERDLMEEILKDPLNDTRRSVLADWYKDNNQWDRGEFIMTQLELARLSEKTKVIPADFHSNIPRENPLVGGMVSVYVPRDSVRTGEKVVLHLGGKRLLPVLVKTVLPDDFTRGPTLMCCLCDRHDAWLYYAKDAQDIIRLREEATKYITDHAEQWKSEDPYFCLHTDNEKGHLDPLYAIAWFRGLVHLVSCSQDHWIRDGRYICMRHPVEHVFLKNKLPSVRQHDGRNFYRWYVNGSQRFQYPQSEADYVPMPYTDMIDSRIFRHLYDPSTRLPVGERADQAGAVNLYVQYDDPEQANELLSCACLKYAKS